MTQIEDRSRGRAKGKKRGRRQISGKGPKRRRQERALRIPDGVFRGKMRSILEEKEKKCNAEKEEAMGCSRIPFIISKLTWGAPHIDSKQIKKDDTWRRKKVAMQQRR